MSGFKVLEWKSIGKGSLLGFCKVEMPSGLVINEIGVFSGERGLWASPPWKPMLSRTGPVLGTNGKPRYAPMVEFVSKELRDRWSETVVAALLQEHPELWPG